MSNRYNEDIKSLKKSMLINKGGGDDIEKQEKQFKRELDEMKPFQISSPLYQFIKNYKAEKLEMKVKTQQEKVIRMFMLLMEMENMNKDEKNNIFHGKNLKTYIHKLTTKPREIKKLEQDNSFMLPKEHLYLHKKGKIGRKHLLRKSYLTTTAFGQIKNENKNKLYKPQQFENQEMFLETKNEVQEKKKKEEEMKKKKQQFKKILKWPSNSDIKECFYRLRFRDLKNNRERALYYKDSKIAQRMKNNAIVQRLIKEDPNKKTKLRNLISIWKIKQSEYIYEKYLKKLFKSKKTKKMQQYTDLIIDKTKYYLKCYYPNLYDSSYDPMNTFNFEDNSHINIKNNQRRITEQNIDETEFATIIQNDQLYEIDENEIRAYRDAIISQSPFEKLDLKLPVNQGLMKDIIDSLEIQEIQPYYQRQQYEQIFKHMFQNSIVILHLDKILTDNVFIHKECFMDNSEIDKLIFLTQVEVDQGTQQQKSLSFVEEETSEYLCFNVGASFKVNETTLQNIKIKIINKLNGDILYEEKLNLLKLIDSCNLENILNYGFRFKYKGVDLEGILSFILLFIPRNLETSHMILNTSLIEKNFEKFQQLLTTINTYIDFRKYFFDKQYRIETFKQNETEYYYHFNKHLDRFDQSVRHQENMLLNSQKPENLEEMILLLKDIIEKQYTQEQILIQSSDQLEQGIDKKQYPIYDSIVKVSNLISIQERMLLINNIYEFKNKKYIRIEKLNIDMGYHKSQIELICKEIKQYLNQNKYITKTEKYLSYDYIFRTYILLENNKINEQKLPILFSKHYIPLIIKIIQLNIQYLDQDNIQKIILNTIINQQYMNNYSGSNSLMHYNRSLVLFKLLFKHYKPNSFSILMDYMISFDNIIINYFMNSFANIFNTINLNIYLDYKNLIYLIILSQEKELKILQQIQQYKISFHVFIDILFIISTLDYQIENFKNIEPHQFIPTIILNIKKVQNEFQKIFSKIFKLMDYIFSSKNKIYDNFEFLIQIIEKRHQQQIYAYKNFASNIKSMNIQKDKLQKMIQKELIKNTMFTTRAQAVYLHKDNIEQDNEASISEIQNIDKNKFNSIIQKDIFFEIADEFPENEYEQLEELHKKKLLKYGSAIVYINNIEVKLTENQYKKGLGNSDLNNILEFEMYDFQQLIGELFNCNESMKAEIYNDLSILSDKQQISLIQFIISLIIVYTDNKYEISEMLQYLTQQLTQIYYENTKEHFDQIVSFIMNEIYNNLPFAYFNQYEINQLQNDQQTNYCYIKIGKIQLNDNEIDITRICIKHFVASQFIRNIPSIHFNDNFCEDLNRIFEEMLDKNQIESDFDYFEVYIDIIQQGKSKPILIPFKINFDNNIQTFSQYREPLIFTPDYNIKNLIDNELIKNLFLNSPACYYDVFTSTRSSMDFSQQKFIMNYYHNKNQFLKINLKFKDIYKKQLVNLNRWNYQTPKNQELSKLSINEINIELPYCYFFLSISELLESISIEMLNFMEISDIFKFIQLNNNTQSIKTNSKKKDVKDDTHFFNLKDYQKLSSNSTYILDIILKS